MKDTVSTTNTQQLLLVAATAFLGGILATSIFFKLKKEPAPSKASQAESKSEIEEEDNGIESSEGDEEELSEDTDLSDFDEETDDEERKKLVLVVREDLKMTSGKIAAQCSHATLGVYRKLIHQHKHNKSDISTRNIGWLKHWDVSGCAKIALKVKTITDMNDIKDKVRKAQIPYHTVIDAGKTQIAANSVTVLAVGPAPESIVNQFTGHLKLL